MNLREGFKRVYLIGAIVSTLVFGLILLGRDRPSYWRLADEHRYDIATAHADVYEITSSAFYLRDRYGSGDDEEGIARACAIGSSKPAALAVACGRYIAARQTIPEQLRWHYLRTAGGTALIALTLY